MSEIKLWHPELPNRPGVQKVESAIVVTKNLYATISQDNPSLRLGGLPAYHLKRISAYANEKPGWILGEILVTEKDFIARSNNFDLDIIAKEASRLDQGQDDYFIERRINMIVQAIVRGELDRNQYMDQIAQNWQNNIARAVAEYSTNPKQFTGLRARELFIY